MKFRKHLISSLLVITLSGLTLSPSAQEVKRTPLRENQPLAVKRTPLPTNHPLIGSWRIEVPGTSCYETYSIKADGTRSVTSAEEVVESEFEITSEPSEKGFYKWVDKITKDNGKPDCMGGVSEIGHVATNYIIIHPSKRMFLMCETEDLQSCIGPFILQGSGT